MTANFLLKQHLKLSPNAQVKNLVPENLTEVPPEEEWKAGRFWYNTTIGKLQGVFLKLDSTTGLPIQPEELEIRIVGADILGPTKDGEFWPDGLFDFTEQTKIADAVDDINESLKDLSPAEPTLLRGDLNLIDQEFFTGKISRQSITAPDTLRMEGISEGDTINYIIADPTVSATLPTDGLFVKDVQQQQFGRADQGIIAAVIDDIYVDEGINLKEVFNEPGRDYYGVMQGYDPEIVQTVYDIEGNPYTTEINPNKENYKSSSGVLTINTVERYNDFKKWQRGTGTVNFEVEPGKHSLHVEHDGIISGSHLNEEIPTNPFKTNTFDVFFDPNNTAPTSTITNFELLTGDVKYISGVPFYYENISFSLNYRANDLFNYTYWDKPISLIMDGSDHDLLDWNDVNSSLNGLSVPLWSDEFVLLSYSINYNAQNTSTTNVSLTGKAGKPITGWGAESVVTKPILIDTYSISDNSTSLKETFLDEEYRMRIEVVNQDDSDDVILHSKGTWNSSLSLQNGNAQQFMGTLIKAQSNYNEYGVSIDYTGLSSVDQEYYRRLYNTENKPNSNGNLKIVTNGIIGTDFDVFIKLPEVTAWLDLNAYFDNEIFAENYNINGTGCASKIDKTANGYEIQWSAGTFSTADSGYGYLIKIVIKTINCIINEIEEISENWR